MSRSARGLPPVDRYEAMQRFLYEKVQVTCRDARGSTEYVGLVLSVARMKHNSQTDAVLALRTNDGEIALSLAVIDEIVTVTA